jgi:hypothetical protein
MRLRSAALLFLGAMASAAPAPIEIPGGSAGIGFDDLRFSVSLGKILVPAGRTGRLVLLDPATRNVTAVEGFSAKKEYGGGHDDGVTSTDSGRGWVFATDRTSGLLAIIDPAGRRIVSRSKLGGAPDYVRYVAPSGEVWVTEPDSERIAPVPSRREERDDGRPRRVPCGEAVAPRHENHGAGRALRRLRRERERVRLRSEKGAPPRIFGFVQIGLGVRCSVPLSF